MYRILGEKTTKAQEWGLPVVSHLWVEECFKKWAYVDPASHGGRFVNYPQGVNFAEVLGQRGIGNVRSSAVNVTPTAGPVSPVKPREDVRSALSPTKPTPEDRMEIDTSTPPRPKLQDTGGTSKAVLPRTTSPVRAGAASASRLATQTSRSASVTEVELAIGSIDDLNGFESMPQDFEPAEPDFGMDNAGDGSPDPPSRPNEDRPSPPVATGTTTDSRVSTPSPSPVPARKPKSTARPPASTSRRRPRSPSPHSVIDLEDSPPRKKPKLNGSMSISKRLTGKAEPPPTQQALPPVQNVDSDDEDDDISLLPSGKDFLQMLGTQRPPPTQAPRIPSSEPESDPEPAPMNGHSGARDKGKGKEKARDGTPPINSDADSQAGTDSLTAYKRPPTSNPKVQRRIVQDDLEDEADSDADATPKKVGPPKSSAKAASSKRPRASTPETTQPVMVSVDLSSSPISSPPPRKSTSISVPKPVTVSRPRATQSMKPRKPNPVQAHSSEPSLSSSQMSGSTSPRKPSSPVPVKRFLSLKDVPGPSSTQRKATKMTGRVSTGSNTTARGRAPSSSDNDDDSTTPAKGKVAFTQGTAPADAGGRPRRAAAGLADIRLAADMADLNKFTVGMARAKGDARRLDDYEHHGAAHHTTVEPTVKTEPKPRKSLTQERRAESHVRSALRSCFGFTAHGVNSSS